MEDTEKNGVAVVGVTPREGSTDNSEKPTLEKKLTFRSIVESYLKKEDGEIVVMPAATRDPRDPMNIPFWHKVLGLGCLSFFGALIASAELILGAALPVFAIQYAGIDPSTFLPALADTQGGFPAGSNPLAALEYLGGPPIFKIYFLATMPLLVISVANLFLVPLGISLGRRPVIIVAGLIAIAGASWAGESNSLDTHIIARSLQAIGAGSVESLIPFIIQDIVPVHQRNTWISAAFACQGVIIIAIGFSAPYMITNLSWRWIYHSTAIAASFFLVGVFLFLPETRWFRTRAEMGKSSNSCRVTDGQRHLRALHLMYVGNILTRLLTFIQQTVFHAMTLTSTTHRAPGKRTSPCTPAPSLRREAERCLTPAKPSSTHPSSSSPSSTEL
jgi:hypothetical protein